MAEARRARGINRGYVLACSSTCMYCIIICLTTTTHPTMTWPTIYYVIDKLATQNWKKSGAFSTIKRRKRRSQTASKTTQAHLQRLKKHSRPPSFKNRELSSCLKEERCGLWTRTKTITLTLREMATPAVEKANHHRTSAPMAGNSSPSL